MGTIEVAGMLKTLRGERAHVQKELANLDKAIGAIRELVGTEQTPNGRPGKRTMSAAARRKIARATKVALGKVQEGKGRLKAKRQHRLGTAESLSL